MARKAKSKSKGGKQGEPDDLNAGRIQPWKRRPRYWQLDGKGVVLLGGSVEDNLFQRGDLIEQLDALAGCGGNYIRCTMSSRDEGDAWPFERGDDGRYDLTRPGGEYWARFERLLDETQRRGIVLQIELWDRFDFAREPWQANPYNPSNNVNYTPEESGLAEAYDKHPGERENPFFRSVPDLEDNRLILGFQQQQVEELLSRSLPRPNVLYCMDNETNEDPAWGMYWSRYVRTVADEKGVEVHTTEMWDHHDVLDATHENTWRCPEVYSFCDISQNNHQTGQAHWDGAVAFRQRIAETGIVRPVNCVKIYGADGGPYGSSRDAGERFWRNLLAGLASSRFHRPESGLGISDLAQRHIRSMRMFLEAIDLTACEPANDLLGPRDENAAYCAANPPKSWAVFFPDGGEASVDVSALKKRNVEVRWLDVLEGEWLDGPVERDGGRLTLRTPRESGFWTAAVTRSA
jgi:hypothetical protein